MHHEPLPTRLRSPGLGSVLGVWIAVVLMGTGCAKAPATEAESAPPSTDEPRPSPVPDEATPDPTPDPTPTPQPTPGAVDPGRWPTDPRAVSAKEQLGTMLGASVDEIAIVEFEELQWSNGALGCPEPDMSYTQALVEGYRIVLEHGGVTYAYHGKTGEDPFLCRR